MSNTAIICLVVLAFFTGFVTALIAARSAPKDDCQDHPHDLDQ